MLRLSSYLLVRYRVTVKAGRENPKHVKDLYYHLSHYVFAGVRNVKECRYIVQCLAGYKEEYNSRLTHLAAQSDPHHHNNTIANDSAVMNLDGLPADELEEYRFWSGVDTLSHSMHYQYPTTVSSPVEASAKHSNIEALVKLEEILTRIDTGVNNWQRMKNYFQESATIHQLCLTDSQWKLCIAKFSKEHKAGTCAAMLNNQSAQATLQRQKEAQQDEWAQQRLTMQRRLKTSTCQHCGARFRRSHVKCLTRTQQVSTRNCSNEECCSRCSVNDAKCINCALQAASEAETHSNQTATVSESNQPLDDAANIIISLKPSDLSLARTGVINGASSDSRARIQTCLRCSARYRHDHNNCLTVSNQHKSKNCANTDCLNRCKKKSISGYCKTCQRTQMIRLLLSNARQPRQ